MHRACLILFISTFNSIPSGRGSCTGSQVVLEPILNGRGPRAIILRDIDTILCTGAIIAEDFFYDDGSSTASSTVPPIYAVGKELFQLFDRCSYLRIQDSHDFTSTIHLMNDENDPNPVTISATNLLEQSKKVNDIHLSSPSSTLNLTPVELSILFVNDTCWCMMVEPPIIPVGADATIMTNSGKYAHYGPSFINRRIRFGNMAQCMSIASGGELFGGSGLSSTRSLLSIVKRVLI